MIIARVKTTNPRIQCPRCKGDGHVELDGELLITFNLVKKLLDATALKVHGVVSKNNRVGVSAINNRLEDLRTLGLVSRRRNGRQWIYTAVKK